MTSSPGAQLAANPFKRPVPASFLDHYGSELYEFIFYLVGERDEAAYLLVDVFAHASTLEDPDEQGSRRGKLYGLARAHALHYLGEKNWLDALPVTAGPDLPGLLGDIWCAARAIPAFARAVLITEELAALPPSEKSQALG